MLIYTRYHMINRVGLHFFRRVYMITRYLFASPIEITSFGVTFYPCKSSKLQEIPLSSNLLAKLKTDTCTPSHVPYLAYS